MGGCLGSNPNAKAHAQIVVQMKTEEKVDLTTKKLLLLGAGSSGKSTIFKQLKCIHGDGFDDQERDECIHIIRQNCVTGIITILRKCHELYESDPRTFTDCKLDLEDERIATSVQKVIQYGQESFSDSMEQKDIEDLGESIAFLWELDPVQSTFKNRGNYYSFPDNMDYFFRKVREIMSSDFSPNVEDVLKTRVRTTGIIETKYNIEGNVFHICDVGGQRNERKKWIHSFDNVTAVIFVAALNHYNAVLFEDEKKNAMHESIELFREICNSKWFRKTEMILFLNKDDLFREKLRAAPLSFCFGANSGWEGELWDGPDYATRPSGKTPQQDDEYFMLCYNSAATFIQAQYVEQNKNPDKVTFAHITTATDKDNITKVFWDVQHIVIRANLRKAQIL